MEVFVCFQIVPDYPAEREDIWPQRPEDLPAGVWPRRFDTYDESALELGLRLREQEPGIRLTALTVSPVEDTRFFETLFALGYDRVLRVDCALPPFRPRAAAALLASRIAGAGLVLTGRQSALGGSRLTGRYLAERLHMPFVDNVTALRCAGDGFAFETAGDGSLSDGVVTAPAVMMVGDAPWLRIPTLRQRLAAKERAAERIPVPLPEAADDMPLAVARPPRRPPCRFLEGDVTQQAAQLLEALSAAEAGGASPSAEEPFWRSAYGGAMRARFSAAQEPLRYIAAPHDGWIRGYASTPDAGRQGLDGARRVIAAGRGLGGGETLTQMARVAAALGADMAATRAAVLNGWFPAGRQAGVSGSLLRADWVLTLGASGASAFTAGLADCGLVAAVNTDAAAPIFQRADIGIVASAAALLRAMAVILETR